MLVCPPLVLLKQPFQDLHHHHHHHHPTKCILKISLLLKHSQALCASMAAVTYSDWVVPAPGGNRPDVAGAGATHTLSTGPAVVLRHGCCEDFRALVALGDVLVWYPVVWPGYILHKTYK